MLRKYFHESIARNEDLQKWFWSPESIPLGLSVGPIIKNFQSCGLFGARNVHKKILEIPFPKFDGEHNLHGQLLACLGQDCAIKAKAVVGDDPNLDLNPHQLGRLRRTVRQTVRAELPEIDGLVEEISKSV